MQMVKLKLSPKKQAWVNQFKPEKLRGQPLRVSVSIEKRYANELQNLINRMTSDTEDAIKELFEANDYAANYAMDANIGSQARIKLNALREWFKKLFGRASVYIVDKWLDQIDKNSASTLKSTLIDLAGYEGLKTDILSSELRDIFTATVNANVALIKRVPEEYLDQITGTVMRSIQSGQGMKDLIPFLEKQNVRVSNWATNVAADQTRKAYQGITRGRMKALGIKKYEWVHSGGSRYPRPYHRDVLNGKIFELDNPPIADPRTKYRSHPGGEIFCRCTMRVIVDFDAD